MDSQLFMLVILTVSWASPIGLGILLIGLGVYNWGKSRQSKNKSDEDG
jgi:hypothetical protein